MVMEIVESWQFGLQRNEAYSRTVVGLFGQE